MWKEERPEGDEREFKHYTNKPRATHGTGRDVCKSRLSCINATGCRGPWGGVGSCHPEGGTWRVPTPTHRPAFRGALFMHPPQTAAGKGRSGLGGPGNRRARSDGNQHHPRARTPGHAHVRHPPGPRSRDRARTTNTRHDCGRLRSLTILETAL